MSMPSALIKNWFAESPLQEQGLDVDFWIFGSAAVTPVAPANVAGQWLFELGRIEFIIVRFTEEPAGPSSHNFPQ